MIQQAIYQDLTISYLSIFMPPSVQETELLNFLPQADRVAFGFAKRHGRGRDVMFVEECKAEAYFIATCLLYSKYDDIKVNNPTVEDRQKYLRLKIGYGLVEYIAHRSTSTISYLSKKGIKQERVSIGHIHLARNNDDIDCFLALEHCCRDEVDKRIIELYSTGQTREQIAEKLELDCKFVKKTIKRIRKKLRISR